MLLYGHEINADILMSTQPFACLFDDDVQCLAACVGFTKPAQTYYVRAATLTLYAGQRLPGNVTRRES